MSIFVSVFDLVFVHQKLMSTILKYQLSIFLILMWSLLSIYATDRKELRKNFMTVVYYQYIYLGNNISI